MKQQKKIPTIEDVLLLQIKGPWKTKADGELSVLFSLPYDQTMDSFLTYDQEELRKLPTDIRGLRSYKVSNLKKGVIGGLEFHKLRKELLFVLQGSIRMTLTDINQQTKSFVLTNNSTGVYIPPFIIHTYEVLEDNTSLIGFVNTLFIPEDKKTHDTYAENELREIQEASK